MKLTDYIISFLVKHGVTDIFGYPGGCINHLIDSAYKNESITAHLNYHEQGAAFAACGYAQRTNKLGVAYSTSGPGATNLITGVASAYFDYIPTLFITGQVDSPAGKGERRVRQRGFQETDIVSCMRGITKWAYHIDKPEDIRFCLEKAYHMAFEGSPGPVVLDIPNDIQRMDVDEDALEGYAAGDNKLSDTWEQETEYIIDMLHAAKRPVILAGNGLKQNQLGEELLELAGKIGVPVVTSLMAFDLLPYDCPYNFGFIGTNGHRYANFIVEKADFVLALGNRMSVRPLGLKRAAFAPGAQIIRIDTDSGQLEDKVKENEIGILEDLRSFLPRLNKILPDMRRQYLSWMDVCNDIRHRLQGIGIMYPNQLISRFSSIISEEYDISADIGQNLLWVAQSYRVKKGQKVCLSGGNGPMGFSIPAGIGSYYGSGKPVVSFCGDGGLMMNVQELQFIKREKIPNKIVCLNNSALGMVRSWQTRYMEQYVQTTCDSGYESPDMKKIAEAFGLKYTLISGISDLADFKFEKNCAELIEVSIPTEIETKPEGSMHDQNPPIDRELFDEIMNL